jgi:hypothetical protein
VQICIVNFSNSIFIDTNWQSEYAFAVNVYIMDLSFIPKSNSRDRPALFGTPVVFPIIIKRISFVVLGEKQLFYPDSIEQGKV